ncbi:methyltransferase domain-containing protein [Colletotrichum tofieldiae]|nr:methyltransferase domain-containing protein [Colletotrichum tofieldiae]GKT74866.1 methyltransferase domain-containing protein [Colletotrichum tofieldiae]
MTDSSQNPPVPALALRSETASPVGEPSTGLNVAPEAVTNVESEVGPDALEVDDAASLNEAASNIDDQISTYTASLSSSVLDYPTENGRRYHAFRAGWAIEAADVFPNAEILGNDLSAIQPSW